MSPLRIFVTREIAGIRLLGWQFDWRRSHWVPFSVRNGYRHWHVVHLGPLGMLTAAPMNQRT